MLQWANSRKNTGQPLLRKVERDNVAAETSLMHAVFPELVSNQMEEHEQDDVEANDDMALEIEERCNDAAIEMVEEGKMEVDDEDEGVIHSRDKSDSWHKLYNTPLPKYCPAPPIVFKLLHRATRMINEVEENE